VDAVPGVAVSRRLVLIAALVVLVFGLRAIPTATVAPARASGICSLPLISSVCGAVSSVFDGVSWTVDETTGAVSFGGQIIGKIVNEGTGLACKKFTPGWLSGLCTAIVKKLTNTKNGGGGGGSGGTTTTPTTTTTTPTVAPTTTVDQTPADAPQSYLRTSAIAAAAAAAMGTVAHEIGKETKANVASSWFGSLYGRAMVYSAGVALLALLIALAEGAVHGDGALVAQALRAVPFAAVMTGALTAIVALGVAIVDDAGQIIAGPGLSDAKHVLDLLAVLFLALGVASKAAAATGHASIAHATGFVGAMFAIFGVVGAGLIAIELLLREVAIYAGTLFAPLIFAARVWPKLAHAGVRLGQTLAAVVLSKLVLIMLLGLAGEAVLHGGLSGIAMGAGALLVAAAAPGLLYSMFGLAEHAFQGRQLPMQQMAVLGASERMAGVIGWNADRVDRMRGSSNGDGNGSQPASSAEEDPPPPSTPTVDTTPREPEPPVTAGVAEAEGGGE
jgi:hypothetical protein